MEEIFALGLPGREVVTDLANALRWQGNRGGCGKAAFGRVNGEPRTLRRLHLDKGREALRIHRRHEHLNFLFEDILGFGSERARAMACVLEHEMDEEAEARIMGFVDYLARARKEGAGWVNELLSAMGDDQKLPRPLTMIQPGERGVITRVTADEPLRSRLFTLGLAPGAGILRKRSPGRGDDSD